MDIKHEVSSFIRYICSWIEYEYKNEGYVAFQYDLNNDRLAWIINDKGIEKRIQKDLNKRLGLNSDVVYTLLSSENTYPNGELRVILKEG